MKKMIEYIERIKEIDTKGVEPLINVFEKNENVFREDIVTNKDDKDKIMMNAPEKEADLFVVPKTV